MSKKLMRLLGLGLLLLPVPSMATAKFSALEYFSTYSSEQPRNPAWPSKVHFLPTISEVPLTELISGEWTIRISCDGRALSEEQVNGSGYKDGVIEPSVNFFLSTDGRAEFFLVAPTHRTILRTMPRLEQFAQGTFKTMVEEQNRLRLVYATAPTLIEPDLVEFATIQENGEIILIDRSYSNSSFARDLCPAEQPIVALWLRLPSS